MSIATHPLTWVKTLPVSRINKGPSTFPLSFLSLPKDLHGDADPIQSTQSALFRAAPSLQSPSSSFTTNALTARWPWAPSQQPGMQLALTEY